MLRRPIDVVEVKRRWALQTMLRWPPGFETALARCSGDGQQHDATHWPFWSLLCGPDRGHALPDTQPATTLPHDFPPFSGTAYTHPRIHTYTHSHVHLPKRPQVALLPLVHLNHASAGCTPGCSNDKPASMDGSPDAMTRLAVSMAEVEIHLVSLRYRHI